MPELECEPNGWLRCTCDYSNQHFEGRFHVRMLMGADGKPFLDYISCVSCGGVYWPEQQIKKAVADRTGEDE